MFSTIKRHKLSAALCGTGALFVIAGVSWSYGVLHGVEQPLILHFSDHAGINRIGEPGELLGIGITALVGIAVNFLIALVLEERNLFLARFVGAATLCLSILLFIGFAAIISVN